MVSEPRRYFCKAMGAFLLSLGMSKIVDAAYCLAPRQTIVKKADADQLEYLLQTIDDPVINLVEELVPFKVKNTIGTSLISNLDYQGYFVAPLSSFYNGKLCEKNSFIEPQSNVELTGEVLVYDTAWGIAFGKTECGNHDVYLDPMSGLGLNTLLYSPIDCKDSTKVLTAKSTGQGCDKYFDLKIDANTAIGSSLYDNLGQLHGIVLEGKLAVSSHRIKKTIKKYAKNTVN